MRQLGVRSPESPPVETDVEAPPEILPHERFAAEPSEPVEVHRVEWNANEAASADQPRGTVAADADAGIVSLPDEPFAVEEHEPVQVYRIERNPMNMDERAARPRKPASAQTHPGRLPERPNPRPAPVPFPERSAAAARAPIGRWEEFHEFRHAEPKRGGRLHLEPVPLRQDSSSKLLTADLERERRSSLLTLVVPAIAALVVVGALLWSGLLQYRVHQQNAAMSALQQRNQKLVETLSQMNGEQMSGEQKASGADVAQNPAAVPPSAIPSGGNSQATVQPETRPENRQSSKRQSKNRQGVSVPPPVQQSGQVSAHRKGAQYRQPADTGYKPEIVPPYPTNFKSENVAVNAANSQPVPSVGTYHPPFTPGAPSASGANQQPVSVAGSNHPAPAATTPLRPSVSQPPAPSRSPAAPPAKAVAPAVAPETTMQYQATGNGEYASPLAQNIEVVEGMQRHSAVQLKEFHARAGASTQATPNVRLSVQNPDQGRGNYTLVVDERGSSRQLRGQVNHPLVFTDTATHHEYALVVLSIADQQVYGYVRATQ